MIARTTLKRVLEEVDQCVENCGNEQINFVV